MSRKQKPDKPSKNFPLTAHSNGQWCKKIKGRLHYFGPWEDPHAARERYLNQKDDLYAGRKPRIIDPSEATFGLALDRFLSSKKLAEESDEITSRSYGDYQRTCDRLAKVIKPARPLSDIDIYDLLSLRANLLKGYSPATARGELTRARMVFLFINEYMAEKPIPYRRALKSPDQRSLRKLANERGPRMYDREELWTMLNAAPLQLRAMILLGINCAFGNSDCGALPLDKLDLEGGWHDFWRPKTHNPRRCPLWPETVEALQAVINARPEIVSQPAQGLVFVTMFGHPWTNAKEERDNAIKAQFRRLLMGLGMYRKYITTFYSLRRTFETIGATAGEQIAVNYIMGHIAPTNDMAAIYRQKMFDGPLKKVTDHVRAWLTGETKIV